MRKISPIKLEIFRNRLSSICDEMLYVLIRTAYSVNIKDRMDCSCAVCSTDGEVIAQTQLGTPVHLGTMSFAVERLLRERGRGSIGKGDVFLFNSPFPEGPGHLPDITVISPIFFQDSLIAFAAAQAHNIDLGGIQPGSTPFGVTEIYQEGLQIPVVRIVKAGEVQKDLLALIMENVRVPRVLEGDIWAEIASNNRADTRLEELCIKYGVEEVLMYSNAVIDHAEIQMRECIKEIPDGEFTYEDMIEGDSITDDAIFIRVAVKKHNDSIILDFSESDDQARGPVNCRPSLAAACSYYAVKSLVDPDLPANGGAYRPIKIKTRPGSILQAEYPAPVGNANGVTTQRIVDTIWGAMAKAMPERVNAACAGTITGCTVGGYDPIHKRIFSYVETYGGGQGALPDSDGMDGIHTHMSNTRNSPVEVLENEYPFIIESYGLIPDSGGAGKFRGGLGIRRVIRFLAGDLRFTLSSDREKTKPWGLYGGSEGMGTRYILIEGSDKRRLPVKYNGVINSPGTRLIIETAGGGGLGSPVERDYEKIENDLNGAFITPEKARIQYQYPESERKQSHG